MHLSQQQNISLSTYQKRLSTLVHGYSNKIINIPNDISQLIVQSLDSKDKLIVNEIIVHQFGYIQSEIYFEPFFIKVLKHKDIPLNIKEYCIEYRFHRCSEQLGSIKSISITNIYKQGIAFFAINHLPITQDMHGLWGMKLKWSTKVSVINNQNECVLKTDWYFEDSYYPYLRNAINPSKSRIDQHFDELFDIDHKGYITINDWLTANGKLADMRHQFTYFWGNDIFDFERIFYYIISKWDSEEYSISAPSFQAGKKKSLSMDKQQFFDFVSTHGYTGYYDAYNEMYKEILILLRAGINREFAEINAESDEDSSDYSD